MHIANVRVIPYIHNMRKAWSATVGGFAAPPRADRHGQIDGDI